jgi:starch phosphorylase
MKIKWVGTKLDNNTSSIFIHQPYFIAEALEKWPLDLFRALLPRHLEIIFEINRRFLESVANQHPGNEILLSNLSIIDETGSKSVRMAHLATVGSHTINGVSQLHSQLLKDNLLADFAKLNTKNIINVTNGVTPRRWMMLYNPLLSKLISASIGNAWITNTEQQLSNIESLATNEKFISQWQKIKLENKRELAHLILQRTGIAVNPKALFDVQVKRIHEYKRQHLCVLHIIYLYQKLKSNKKTSIQPRVFIFGGKAAPGYVFAKLIIRLINAVADVVNNDSEVNEKMKVVFFPNYSVKNSEWVYRAADLSEQVSTAGKEASGTGNMKFALNGALTIGTLDGANVEMREAVGAENFFLFGLNAQQVTALKPNYNPKTYYQNYKPLKEAIDAIADGTFSDGNTALFAPIVDSLKNNDPYMLCADFQSYVECQTEVNNFYADTRKWTQMSILNVARMGYFSSDRSIADYCKNVWHIDV